MMKGSALPVKNMKQLKSYNWVSDDCDDPTENELQGGC